MDINNKYTKMQKSFFNNIADGMNKGNHKEHDDNPDYWDILLGDINDDDYVICVEDTITISAKAQGTGPFI